MTGAGEDSIVSSRSKKSRCTTARWQACSCTDHLPFGSRRFSSAGGISRTRGTTISGARSRASITADGARIGVSVVATIAGLPPCGRLRRHVLDRAVRRPDGAAVWAVVLPGLGARERLPVVDTALHPNVPPFLVAENVCRLLDFVAG